MSQSNHIDSICDLSGLYSLGALEGSDLWTFKQHLLECDACQADVSADEAVAGLLGFAADPEEPSPILRFRLIDIVSPEYSRSLSEYDDPDAPWEPLFGPGVEVRKLKVDKARREVVMLVRAKPGAMYPSHRHATEEEMLMLEGELDFEGTVYRAGDYIKSAGGSTHSSSETRTGCMFVLRASFDNEVIGLN